MRKTYNYSYLLAGLLLLALADPVAEQFFADEVETLWLSDAAVLAVLLGVLSLDRTGHLFKAGLVLAVGAVACTSVGVALGQAGVLMLGWVLILAFCTLSAGVALQDVFSGYATVSVNHITGAICIYMLFGVIWAILYQIVESLSPGSFKGLDAYEGGQPLIYYSFVTLTTLGYGDISPLKPAARALAYLQAVFGQVYLAVLVAGLVGMRISSLQSQSRS